MAAKQPVYIGPYTVANAAGTVQRTIDIIVNVSNDLWEAFGSPPFDSTLLEGTPITNNNGDFIYAASGTFSGKTVTLITDGTTPAGNPKTFQMQLPEYCPMYILDRFLDSLSAPTVTFIASKLRGGRRIPVGSTVVTP